VAAGTPDELRSGAATRLRFSLDRVLDVAATAALQEALAAERPGLTVATDGDDARYRIDGAAPDAALVATLAGWCAAADILIVDLRTAGGSLEDVYLDLIAAGRGGASDR
jgi:ABC-2 type transport system ATP-binding protein